MLANSDAADQTLNASVVSGASRTPPNLNAVGNLTKDSEPIPITVQMHQIILRARNAIETWDEGAFIMSKIRAPVIISQEVANSAQP